MKTIRTFLSGCTWCNAKGYVSNPSVGWCTDVTISCPVCNGAGTVTVTETIEDDITINDLKEIDKSNDCKNWGHGNIEDICNTCML